MINPFISNNYTPYNESNLIKRMYLGVEVSDLKSTLVSSPKTHLWSLDTWWATLQSNDRLLQHLSLYALAQQLPLFTKWYPQVLTLCSNETEQITFCLSMVALPISDEDLIELSSLIHDVKRIISESLAKTHFQTLCNFAKDRLQAIDQYSDNHNELSKLTSIFEHVRITLDQQYDQQNEIWETDHQRFKETIKKLIDQNVVDYILPKYMSKNLLTPQSTQSQAFITRVDVSERFEKWPSSPPPDIDLEEDQLSPTIQKSLDDTVNSDSLIDNDQFFDFFDNSLDQQEELPSSTKTDLTSPIFSSSQTPTSASPTSPTASGASGASGMFPLLMSAPPPAPSPLIPSSSPRSVSDPFQESPKSFTKEEIDDVIHDSTIPDLTADKSMLRPNQFTTDTPLTIEPIKELIEDDSNYRGLAMEEIEPPSRKVRSSKASSLAGLRKNQFPDTDHSTHPASQASIDLTKAKHKRKSYKVPKQIDSQTKITDDLDLDLDLNYKFVPIPISLDQQVRTVQIQSSPYVASRDATQAEGKLSDKAGHPGPLEYSIKKSKKLTQWWHRILGLYSIYILHVIDSLWDLVSGYIKNIFKIFMIIRSSYRVRQRIRQGRLAQATQEDAMISLKAIEELYYIPSNSYAMHTQLQKLKNNNIKAVQEFDNTLELALYVRTSLDTLQRDIGLVHKQSIKQGIIQEIKSWVWDLIPKPWNIFRPLIDAYHLGFKIKFTRKDSLIIYQDLLFALGNLCHLLQCRQDNESGANVHFKEAEEALLLSYIKQCKDACDRFLKLSVQSHHLAMPHKWSTAELFTEWILQNRRNDWFESHDLFRFTEDNVISLDHVEDQANWFKTRMKLHPVIQELLSIYLLNEVNESVQRYSSKHPNLESFIQELSEYQKQLIVLKNLGHKY
jgi:hypothetical protein